MTVNSTENTATLTLRRTTARLASDELTVLEKLGEDVVTVNLDITLKPVTWIALQKYALKHDCTLSESLENGLEESEQVASAINIRQSDR
jgi:macrodomain Ter protein organizer (MatP/YcbG family)